MLATAIAFSRYYIALLFGTTVATSFAGMDRTKKNYLVLWGYTVFVFLIQLLCLWNYGMDMTLKLYPFICHLPIVLFILVYVKRSWLIALISTFTAFLCCQPPRWIGAVAGLIFHTVSMDHIGYNVTAILSFFLLQKYAVESVQNLLKRSLESCLLFGAMPTFYYLFDYSTTVYTDFMYSGSRAAIQFMPFLTATFYLIFVLLYDVGSQKQARIQRERNMLDTQLKQAQTELASMRQMQQNAASYRHDMRHHITLLQSLASEGRLEEIKEYLQTAQSDIDSITPIRYCENETVNLILSSFASKAKQAEINLTITAKLPEVLNFSDTELCSLLSNALENAIHACKNIADSSKRFIMLRLYAKNNKLCIDIRNSFHIEPVFHYGLPASQNERHGFGTKSMANIVEKHGGVFQFSVKDGWFIFQATA